MNTEWKPIAAHWYAVDKHGAATLCTCEEDARETAAESAQMFPNCAPYTAVQLAPVSAPTSHPIPTGATGDRDWELVCDECNGSGHVLVKHQVAERKTDVQEFKEECEACEGRGFNIAFEDIPGIADYVKSCGSDAGVTGEDEQSAFERWLERTCPSGDVESVQRQWEASSDYADFHAPAAGDALAWHGLTDAERDGFVGEIADYGTDFVSPLYAVVENIERRLRDKNAAIAQQKGEA